MRLMRLQTSRCVWESVIDPAIQTQLACPIELNRIGLAPLAAPRAPRTSVQACLASSMRRDIADKHGPRKASWQAKPSQAEREGGREVITCRRRCVDCSPFAVRISALFREKNAHRVVRSARNKEGQALLVGGAPQSPAEGSQSLKPRQGPPQRIAPYWSESELAESKGNFSGKRFASRVAAPSGKSRGNVARC